MDCIITKTIPIYYGCENIGEYFDTTGWIILEDENNFLQELYNKLHTLNESYYITHYPTIIKNYEKAILLSNSDTNLINILKPHLS